jgi:hypothetical protein
MSTVNVVGEGAREKDKDKDKGNKKESERDNDNDTLKPPNGRADLGMGSRRSSLNKDWKMGSSNIRRDSNTAAIGPGTTSATVNHAHANANGTKEKDRFIERQYSHALSYSLDFLSDMLSPPRSACNRKFEICVDELVFVGHPVCIGKDGKWAVPDEEAEERESRGRSGRPPPGMPSNPHVCGQGRHLRAVVEAGEANVEALPHQDQSPSGTKTEKKEKEDDGPPTLNMFHLVLILDKPDPKVGAPTEGPGAGATGAFDEVYREIAFKWTAAAWALQVRDNFIERESWEMAKMRDKCLNEGTLLSSRTLADAV